jgi:hypothetical protein
MDKLLRFLVIASLAVFPKVALGFILDPCFGAGLASFTYASPGPNDPVGYKLLIPTTVDTLFTYPDYKHIWVKQSQADSTTFVVDVILTDDSTTFPNYYPVNRLDQNWGFVPPLAPGFYTLLGTINVYDASTGTLQPECDPQKFGNPQRSSPFVVYTPDDVINYQNRRAVETAVIEYYDAVLDHYFMTSDVNEIQALNSLKFAAWVPTGNKFMAYSTPYGAGTRVTRYYGLPSAGLDSHFFTVDYYENAYVQTVLSTDWIIETTDAFEILEPLTATGFCPANTLPVYRLWNGRTDSNHRYSIDPMVRQQMIAKGWIPEGYGPDGVVMCSPAL